MAQLINYLLVFTLLANASYADWLRESTPSAAAKLGQFPYHVSIQDNGKHVCSGSIVAPTKILTSAYCLSGIGNNFTVEAGSIINGKGEQSGIVSKFVIHELWNCIEGGNDIAVLTLEQPFVFSSTVNKVILATKERRLLEPTILTTWLISDACLKWIQLQLIDVNKCSDFFSSSKNILTAGQICTLTATMGSARRLADIGGALVDTSFTQIGISSWHSGENDPDVFTSVAFYDEWIRRHIL